MHPSHNKILLVFSGGHICLFYGLGCSAMFAKGLQLKNTAVLVLFLWLLRSFLKTFK